LQRPVNLPYSICTVQYCRRLTRTAHLTVSAPCGVMGVPHRSTLWCFAAFAPAASAAFARSQSYRPAHCGGEDPESASANLTTSHPLPGATTCKVADLQEPHGSSHKLPNYLSKMASAALFLQRIVLCSLGLGFGAVSRLVSWHIAAFVV